MLRVLRSCLDVVVAVDVHVNVHVDLDMDAHSLLP